MSWPVSEAFEEATLAAGRTVVTRVSILSAGALVAQSDLIDVYNLRYVDGGIESYQRAEVRRSMTLTFVDDTGVLTPLASGDLLDPVTGNEVKVEIGLVLDDGTTEMVPQGVFGIESATVTDDHGMVSIMLSGMDRARRVSVNKWRTPYTIAAATNTATAIQGIITNRLTTVGTVLFNFAPTTQTVASILSLGGDDNHDPWKEAQNLALGIGMELFFDRAGVCVLRPVPDPTAEAEEYEMGTGEQGLIIDPVARTIDRTTLRNGAMWDPLESTCRHASLSIL